MSLLDLIPGAPVLKLIGYGLVAATALGGLGWVVHSYNEKIREPLRKEVRTLETLRQADAEKAQQLTAKRAEENAAALTGYIDYARTSDQKFADANAVLERLRIAAAAKQRGSTPGPAGQSGAGTPESPAAAVAGGDLGYSATDETIAVYAAQQHLYAQSCYEFVAEK